MHLLVASKILPFASKVFEAMFNNGVAEGQSLSLTSPSEISLSDDHPVRMSIICKIMHMETSDVSDTLMIVDLGDFVVRCRRVRLCKRCPRLSHNVVVSVRTRENVILRLYLRWNLR